MSVLFPSPLSQARKDVEEAKAARDELERRVSSQAAQLEAVTRELGSAKPQAETMKTELSDARRELTNLRAKAAGLEVRRASREKRERDLRAFAHTPHALALSPASLIRRRRVRGR